MSLDESTDADNGSTDPAIDAIEDYAPKLVELLNDSHTDSLLLIARALGDRPSATAALATTVDRRGIEISTTGDGSTAPVRIALAREVDSIDDLLGEAFNLLTVARDRAAELGIETESTNAEVIVADRAAIPTWIGEVVSNEPLNAAMRRLVVRGDRLGEAADRGPDQFYYLLAPPPGSTELGIDESFTWGTYEEMPEAERPVGAYYTARFIDAAAGTITFDVLLHGETGTGSRWGASAAPGSPVALWGPRTAYEPPADTDWHLLVVDETGLPAVAEILEHLDDDHQAIVVFLADEVMAGYALPDRPSITAVHLPRTVPVADESTDPFTATLAELDWPAGNPYVWGGGEAKQMTAARRYVRDVRGLPLARVSLVAYWRRDADDH